ncbi:MAG: Structural maintenance of chromosomes protein 6 [Watsoniomyces obsoletus]|nr:MAG: Structural maintenance of chromosomes protein 6 [Watsoniomyces obsoletus]
MVGVLLNTGQSIPPNTPYAVSVSLPTWEANVGYEEGEEWVLSKMRTGYPRFFIHECIGDLKRTILEQYGNEQEDALLFPSHRLASACLKFIKSQEPQLQLGQLHVVDIPLKEPVKGHDVSAPTFGVSAAVFPKDIFRTAKSFWQHSGEGISSRQADFCHRCLKQQLVPSISDNVRPRPSRGPKRYQREPSLDGTQSADFSRGSQAVRADADPVKNDAEKQECSVHIEERYGRNLNSSLAAEAKLAVRKRIAGLLTANVELRKAIELPRNPQTTRLHNSFSEDDVYLYPTGMSSIFNIHKTLLSVKGSLPSVCFGFPYIDTLKILQKWGSGCIFYGNGSCEELDDLERRLETGQQVLGLFCEFPSNPLLRSPDLRRIRALADKYMFPVVVDETVGNFLNVHVLSMADVVVSSLTKIFSGDSNVMGGSAVLNPQTANYRALKDALSVAYEDNYWAEDAIVMERNSRDFAGRIHQINHNAEAICKVLQAHPRVKEVYYPKYSPTRQFYDHCRNRDGGYGGLLSVTFFTTAEAVTFFDQLETAKGPSLGTNFTLSCPYTLLAHYGELDWAASFGVESDLIRVSVGLEETGTLIGIFQRALNAVAAINACQ